jgi:uracil-DNA glycosylase family 4
VVKPVGPLDAKMCFIGEAPGEHEDRLVTPFIGSAGQLLKRVFAKKRIIYSECLVGNIFHQRPPKNNVGYFYEDPGPKQRTKLTWEGMKHLERLRLWLERLLEVRKRTGRGPNVLIALGRTPMYHLTGKKRVYKWRGSILPCILVPGFKVYVTLHPSGVQRTMNEEGVKLQGMKKERSQNALPLFEIDMDRIKIQAETPDYAPPQRKFEISLSFGELCSRLEWVLREKPPLLACDIETLQGAHGPVVWCIGFASTPREAFVIPIIRQGTFAWSLDEEAHLWRLISKIFLEPRIRKIFQGGMYDLAVLGRYYGLRVAVGTWGDTMYCHHASYPYLWKSLEVLASIYTWEPYYKDEGRVNVGSRTDESEFRYNGKDDCVTREIYPITVANAKELQTYKGYKRTMGILPSHLGMTIRGMKIDRKKKEELSKRFTERAKECQKAVEEATKMSINLNSHTQKARLLYGYLGLDLQIKRVTKKVTTDKDALNKLRRKYVGTEKGKIVEWILDYQKFAKLASTYADMKLDSDGRIRTSYSLVSTWRMNSFSSPFGGWTKKDREGGNLQNIPVRSEEGRMIRELFIPDEGMVLLASDRRQAEAMVVAWDSQDVEQINLFLKGEDLHWEKATKIFAIPEGSPYDPKTLWRDLVTGEKHTLKEYRDIGKTIVFAGYYGAGYTNAYLTYRKEEGIHG